MRVLLHAHTTYSHDGRLSPQELAALARSKGFDAVLVSDHYEDLDEDSYGRLDRECEAVDTCMLVPGYEKDWSDFTFAPSAFTAGSMTKRWTAGARRCGRREESSVLRTPAVTGIKFRKTSWLYSTPWRSGTGAT